MKKILMSLMAIGLVVGLVGAGTMAYFSDEETSTGNTFTAGTLDLTPNNPGAFVSGLTNLAPGVDNPAQTITLTNSGTLDGAEMDIDVNITGEADNTPLAPDGTGTNMTAAGYAEALRVDTLTWKGVDLLSLVTEDTSDGNNYKDLKEVAAANLSNQAGLTVVEEAQDFVLDVTLDPNNDYGNAPQGDGVVIEVVFDLSQITD